jgi:hypothetical protein
VAVSLGRNLSEPPQLEHAAGYAGAAVKRKREGTDAANFGPIMLIE